MGNDISFEEKMKRLEEIVNTLESENSGIEATIGLFQEGMALGRECKKILSDIELKVNNILNVDENGKLELESVDDIF